MALEVCSWVRPTASYAKPAPAVFLDRDGVLIEDCGYLSEAGKVRCIAGSCEAVARLNKARILAVVVTNQSGIGRGYYGWEQFREVQQALESKLESHGAHLDAVWACASYTVGDEPGHPFRKPNPGMIREATVQMGLDLERSWMVGDRKSDIEAGLRAGVQGAIHVLSGVGADTRAEISESPELQALGDKVRMCFNLAEAVDLILGVRENEVSHA